jgi:hypothetical protein
MQANTNENDYYDARILGEIASYSQRLMPVSAAFTARSRIFMIANNKSAIKGAEAGNREIALPHRGSLFHPDGAPNQR